MRPLLVVATDLPVEPASEGEADAVGVVQLVELELAAVRRGVLPEDEEVSGALASIPRMSLHSQPLVLEIAPQ